MTNFYQQSDEVIEAARVLKQEIIDDAPFGNDAEAEIWARTMYPQVFALAAQGTEAEEERAGMYA